MPPGASVALIFALSVWGAGQEILPRSGPIAARLSGSWAGKRNTTWKPSFGPHGCGTVPTPTASQRRQYKHDQQLSRVSVGGALASSARGVGDYRRSPAEPSLDWGDSGYENGADPNLSARLLPLPRQPQGQRDHQS